MLLTQESLTLNCTNYHSLKSFARRWSSAQPVAIPGIKLT